MRNYIRILSFLFLAAYSYYVFSMNPIDCIPPELRNLPYAVYPDSANYDSVRLNYNKLFVYFPKAIFIPTNNTEIQFVFTVLKRNNLEFSIRSGRHCFESCSLSSN